MDILYNKIFPVYHNFLRKWKGGQFENLNLFPISITAQLDQL